MADLVIVSKEPTEEMKRSGMSAFMAAHDPFYSKNEPTAQIYKAMLAASPSSVSVDEIVRVLEMCLDAIAWQCPQSSRLEVAEEHVRDLLALLSKLNQKETE